MCRERLLCYRGHLNLLRIRESGLSGCRDHLLVQAAKARSNATDAGAPVT